jgi:hypothetical protein
MASSKVLREYAENCAEIAQWTTNRPIKKRFERLSEGWNSVAEAQAWLDGEKKTMDKSAHGGKGQKASP